jgi:hypothetical protein
MRRLFIFLFLLPSLSYAFEANDCSYGGFVYGFTARNYDIIGDNYPPTVDPTEGISTGTDTGVLPFLYLKDGEKYGGTGPENLFAIKYLGVFYGKGTINLYSYVNDGITAEVDGTKILFTDAFGDSCWKVNPVEPYSRFCSGWFKVDEGFHLLTIKYFEKEGVAVINAGWDYPDPETKIIPFPKERFLSPGLMIEYYSGEFASKKYVKYGKEYEYPDEIVTTPLKEWGAQGPRSGAPGDDWSSRWTGYLLIEKDGNYKICTKSDEKARVYIDDVLIIDAWDAHSIREDCNYGDCSKSVFLKMGAHSLHIQHYEGTGDAYFSLGWGNSCDGNVNTFDTIPLKFLVLMGKKCKEPPKPFSQRVVEAVRGGGEIGCEMAGKGYYGLIFVLLPIFYLILRRRWA